MSIICSQKFVTLISIIPACGNLPEQIRWLLMSDVKLGKVFGIHFGTCTQFRPIKATYPSCLQIDDFSSVRFFQDIILRQKKRELCRQNFVLDCDGSGYQNRRCSGLRGSLRSQYFPRLLELDKAVKNEAILEIGADAPQES